MAGYTDDLITRDREMPRSYEGEIANTPATESSDVFVIFRQFDDGQFHHGPCRWTPRPAVGGTAYPSEGDTALVVISDAGEYWILGWWPYA